MGLPHSHRVSRVRWYSGYSQAHSCFAYGAFTLFRAVFQQSSATLMSPFMWVLTPHIFLYTVWALTSSLATTGVIIVLFSLPLGTKMFQFPRFPSSSYVFTWRYLYPHIGAFPHSDIYGWFRSFAAHRSFSQLVTSFFGAWCQGIHRTLFFRLVSYAFAYVPFRK